MIAFLLFWLHIFLRPSQDADSRDDDSLLQAFRSSLNPAPLGVLFNRYIHIVFGICMKYLKEESAAEDATMQIFEVLVEKVPHHEIDNFGGWLATVSRNHCLMQLRKQQSKQKRKETYTQNNPSHVEWEDETHLSEEERMAELDRMSAAMQQLKPEQRTCLELFFLEECSYQEVMKRTGWDYKAVKSHIQNGKRNLKKLMLEL